MRHAAYLAMRSLWWNRGRSATMVACLAITLWLPITVRLFLAQVQSDLTARADSTPLLLGAPGSRIELALHGLYFSGLPAMETNMGQVDQIADSGLSQAIPLYVKYRTQNRNGQPGVFIVGTAPEYFEFRELRIAQGEFPALLGDCVAGASAARQLGLQPGDSLLSAPQNAFDLAGDYPLKMRVTGILEPMHTADDDVVFTDTRTVWIIDGIGHGHQALKVTDQDDRLLKSSDNQVTASAAVLPYTEVTAENLDSFHFHGNPDDFPVSAIIAVPNSDRDRIRLRGRYQTPSDAIQCIQPAAVVAELMRIVFRVEQLVRISSLVALAVTSTLLILVLVLSVKLREKELQTMFQLGCSRAFILRMLGAEIFLLLLLASALATLGAGVTQYFGHDVLQQFLF